MGQLKGKIDKIRIAAEIASHIVDIIPEFLKAGMTEKKVESIIKKHIKLKGGHRESFKIIVASGKRSAMMHGYATKKVIRKNEVVMVDIGVHYDGYCSDITRMFYMNNFGGASHAAPVLNSNAPSKVKKIYNIVKSAQIKAIKKVKDGIPVAKIDMEVRKEFRKYGLEKYFTHSTGHGIGEKVHEEPKISSIGAFRLRRSNMPHRNGHRIPPVRLKSGQVITIEPGLYFKGKFGIRIEDMVLVKKNGYEILTT